MYCLICKQKTEFKAHALIAPWITRLTEGKLTFSKLFHCESCEFKFFEYRFSALEVSAIYSGYRRDRYEKLRKKWEPWYTSGMNNLYTNENSLNAVSKRKSRMTAQFQEAGLEMNFKNCLDFGGDDGQFFPESVAGNRYLIDPSAGLNQNQKNGIRTATDIESIEENLDLIMCCMVLEHMSELDGLISAVDRKLSKNDDSRNGIFYIELPMDGFKVGKWAKSRTYYYYLFALSKIPLLFILVDFYSGIFRNYFRRIPFMGIVKQSEHINYFSQESISKLIEKRLDVQYISDENLNEKYGHYKLGFISAIGIKR